MARGVGEKPAAGSAAGRTAVPGVVVFHGPDRYEMITGTAALRARLEAAHGEVTPVMFDAAPGARASGPVSAAEVLDECRALTLMMQHKLVIVDHAEHLLKESDEATAGGAGAGAGAGAGSGAGGGGGRTARELMTAYAERPDASSTLVLRAERWYAGKLDKAVLAGGGTMHECRGLGAFEAAAWVMERARAAEGVTMTREAAEALVEAVGVERARLDSECAKLAVAALARAGARPGAGAGVGVIDETLVRHLVGATREEEFWSIQPDLLGGDAAAALGHLQDLLEVSRIDVTPLLFTYMDLARKLHTAARGLKAGESPRAVAGSMRLFGRTGEAIMETARRIDPEAAGALVGAVIDATVKTRSGLAEPVRALEALTLEFTSLTAR